MVFLTPLIVNVVIEPSAALANRPWPKHTRDRVARHVRLAKEQPEQPFWLARGGL
jgi:hypothetical protein